MSAILEQPSCSKSTKNHNENDVAEKVLGILKPLEELLKCHICFDYFNTCVITKCCHSFCSLCIRKYMMYKSRCPECFQEATEPELRSNRQIDEILIVYNKIKDFLGSPAKSKSDLPDCDKADVRGGNESKETSLNRGSSLSVPVCDAAASSATSSTSEEVSCPSCSAVVLAKDINSHLDICLTKKPRASRLQNIQKRQPLPKVVYHLLTDKEIRKRLRDRGLSTVGDRQSLINRHKNFIVLYNAECDALNPRPVADIVKQVEKEEQEAEKSSPAKLFQSSKKSSLRDIHQENEKYLKQNKQQFDALIGQIKSRSVVGRCRNASATAETEKDASKNFSNDSTQNDELVIEMPDESDDNQESRENSPDLFDNTESESENSNSAKLSSFDSQNCSNPAKAEKNTSPERGCYIHSSGSSDDFRICKSMKESKRFKRKMADNDSPT